MTRFYGILFDQEAAEEDYWPAEWQHWYCGEDVETSEMKAIVEAAPCAMYRDHSGYDEDPNYFVLRASIHDDEDRRGAPELPPDADEILRRECERAKAPWQQPKWYSSYGQFGECA